MFTSSWNSFAAIMVQINHPPVFFLTGLLGSMLICLLLLTAQSALRYRRHGDPHLFPGNQNYQRYRHELISSPRHVGFAGSILELDDRDWRAD